MIAVLLIEQVSPTKEEVRYSYYQPKDHGYPTTPRIGENIVLGFSEYKVEYIQHDFYQDRILVYMRDVGPTTT